MPLPEGPLKLIHEASFTVKFKFFKTAKVEEASRTKFLLKLFTWITGSVLAFSVALGTAATQSPKKALRILAYGDSLTAGMRMEPKNTYPQQLESLFKKDGYTVSIQNAGVSGDTTRQGVARVSWALKGGPYDVVLLGLGANDGLRQLPLKELDKNLRSLVTRFQKEKARVILLGMKLPTNFNAKYRDGFEAVYRQIAKDYKLTLYPFLLEGVAADEKLNLEDGIHPNSQGYEVIAKNLYAFLKTKIF